MYITPCYSCIFAVHFNELLLDLSVINTSSWLLTLKVNGELVFEKKAPIMDVITYCNGYSGPLMFQSTDW